MLLAEWEYRIKENGSQGSEMVERISMMIISPNRLAYPERTWMQREWKNWCCRKNSDKSRFTSTVHKIAQEELGYRKVCARWTTVCQIKQQKKKWTYPVYSFKSLPRIHIDRRWDKDVSFHTTKETRLNAVETQFLGRSNLNAWNSVGNLCHLYSRMQKEPSTQNSWLG